jgi:Flp pilus assembly protein TadG
MFRENPTPILSSRAKRGIWVLGIEIGNPESFALGWRSAFSAAINVLRATTALAAEVMKANFSEFPQTLSKLGKSYSPSKDERTASPLRHQVFNPFLETDAAALIEFAVALPLLVVLVVGIFDFGGAFNLKQELSNAAREGARFGASQPTNDLSRANPASVDAVRYVVDSYLLKANINDCDLNSASQVAVAAMTWQYTTTGTCAGALVLTISRANSVQTNSAPPVYLPCTTVQISYPYQWHFNRVIQLLVPSATYAGVSQIPTDATAVNMD